MTKICFPEFRPIKKKLLQEQYHGFYDYLEYETSIRSKPNYLIDPKLIHLRNEFIKKNKEVFMCCLGNEVTKFLSIQEELDEYDGYECFESESIIKELDQVKDEIGKILNKFNEEPEILASLFLRSFVTSNIPASKGTPIYQCLTYAFQIIPALTATVKQLRDSKNEIDRLRGEITHLALYSDRGEHIKFYGICNYLLDCYIVDLKRFNPPFQV